MALYEALKAKLDEVSKEELVKGPDGEMGYWRDVNNAAVFFASSDGKRGVPTVGMGGKAKAILGGGPEKPAPAKRTEKERKKAWSDHREKGAELVAAADAALQDGSANPKGAAKAVLDIAKHEVSSIDGEQDPADHPNPGSVARTLKKLAKQLKDATDKTGDKDAKDAHDQLVSKAAKFQAQADKDEDDRIRQSRGD